MTEEEIQDLITQKQHLESENIKIHNEATRRMDKNAKEIDAINRKLEI